MVQSEPAFGVVALVPEPWGPHWMGRHQLLSRLARKLPVIWVEPARGWREVLRQPRGPRGEESPWPAPEGLFVHRPEPWLPRFYRPRKLADFTFHQRIRRAVARLHRSGCRKVVLSLWRPEFGEALNAPGFDLSVYHVADEYSFSDRERPIDPVERRIMERVDHVVIHSPGLLERKGHFNPHTTYLPNGADFHAYADSAPEPDDLARIPRPRIGYTGFVKRQLHWDLVRSLVERHPDWSFVFVGAVREIPEVMEGLGRLRSRANVHFLGSKTVSAMAPYPQHFDVCMMPYAVNAYTHCIYPLKLHEYLASGRPVVATPIRALEEFSDVVTLATDVTGWSSGIRKALDGAAGGDDRERHGRQAVASQFDWDILTLRLFELLRERLGQGRKYE